LTAHFTGKKNLVSPKDQKMEISNHLIIFSLKELKIHLNI